MLSRAQTVAAAAAVLLLVGCDNPVSVSKVEIAHNYLPEEALRYASGGNELRVVVAGDPFGAGADANADAAVAAMQGQNIGPPLAFALDPSQEAQPPARVVLVFNGRQLVGGQNLCATRDPVETARSTDGVVVVSGAWCQSNYLLSAATARVEEADGLGSEPFEALMGQLTIALFPPENPHHKSFRRPCPPFCGR
ncbi:MAG: hypothetical protein VW644_12525 [Alphaproteobacteria bacterium]|jgi:uncharacterized lipoprotein NlpE involved in copper resistance